MLLTTGLSVLLNAAPALYNLFTSDDKTEAVKDLTSTVVKNAAKEFGVELESKDDLLSYVEKNPDAVIVLKKLELNHFLDIEKLGLKKLELQVKDKELSADMYNKDNSTQKTMVYHIHFQFYFVVIVGVFTMFATASLIDDKGLAMALSAFVSSLVTLVTNRVTAIDGFFFGSSLGSKEKTQNLMKTNFK